MWSPQFHPPEGFSERILCDCDRSIGVISRDPLPETVQRALAVVVRAIVEAGGNVVCAGTVVAPGPFVVDLFEGGDAGPMDG